MTPLPSPRVVFPPTARCNAALESPETGEWEVAGRPYTSNDLLSANLRAGGVEMLSWADSRTVTDRLGFQLLVTLKAAA